MQAGGPAAPGGALTVEETIAALDDGSLRVADKRDGEWVVNEDAKRAILEYFKLRKIEPNSTLNTGNITNERTVAQLERI